MQTPTFEGEGQQITITRKRVMYSKSSRYVCNVETQAASKSTRNETDGSSLSTQDVRMMTGMGMGNVNRESLLNN